MALHLSRAVRFLNGRGQSACIYLSASICMIKDHAARIRAVLQACLVARLLRSLVRGMFTAWHRLPRTWLVNTQHRSDDELSVASASSARVVDLGVHIGASVVSDRRTGLPTSTALAPTRRMKVAKVR